MSASDEQPPKQTRKRDWLDWGQGMVALLTALLAIYINVQQQGLKSQQDIMKIQQDKIRIQQENIDLALKKESATTLFADKIIQQLNTMEDSKEIKGTIILELMGLDIQAHLLTLAGQEERLKKLEEACKEIPSRIALFTSNLDALDASEETKWVEYAYNTDNRIARHTALRALAWKGLHFSPADADPSDSSAEDSAAAEVLSSRLKDILKLSDNLESPDLAIDALGAISTLAERCQNISASLKGKDTLDLILRGMRDLENRIRLLAESDTPDQPRQRSEESKRQSNDQLARLDSTWKCLIKGKFCDDKDRLSKASISSAAR
jgi:hypothetical protein